MRQCIRRLHAKTSAIINSLMDEVKAFQRSFDKRRALCSIAILSYGWTMAATRYRKNQLFNNKHMAVTVIEWLKYIDENSIRVSQDEVNGGD